ncbi:UDP-3-O-(3-hydroxymyristoyl)glucosamine N-acyltransferase [Chitinimonas lacunae]|uniref:UDP-3-O-acylglucosamine N-acyltransferase n=1 Tax=Chitinimonas lacunae TaxID=1963018 RepID=A0ABV8MW15_9NEIS
MPSRPIFRLSELVARLGGELRGADVAVGQVGTLERAGPEQIAFLANPKYRRQLSDCRAGAVILSAAAVADWSGPAIVTSDPYLYFARVSALLNPVVRPAPGIDPSAVVAASAEVAADAYIGPLVSVGEGARIGPRVMLQPGCRIGAEVEIGADSVIHPNAVIYPDCRIGARVIIHAGAVIGADGFGLAWNGAAWEKIPQIGRVVIEDDVEIGASTTIDRGALDDTVIRQGAKLDNQIQIGHNVVVGRHTAMAGCVGVAGSTKIGDYCTFGGSAMIIGHIEIVDRVNVMAGTLVGKSIKQAGTYTGWYPMQPHRDWLANASHLRHLDTLAGRVRQLERKMATGEAPVADEGDSTP